MKEFKLTVKKTKFKITLEDDLLCIYTYIPTKNIYFITLTSKIKNLKDLFKYGGKVESAFISITEESVVIHQSALNETFLEKDYVKFIEYLKYVLDYKKIDRRNKINNINNA